MQDIRVDDVDFRLWVLLDRTRRAVHKLRSKELRRYGISAAEAAVLFFTELISSNGRVTTPTELSRWMLREPHSVWTLLQRMEDKGLIVQDKCLQRKNLVQVSLTEKGKQALEGAVKRESVHQVISSLSEEEHRQLASCLAKVRNEALMKLGIEGTPPFP